MQRIGLGALGFAVACSGMCGADDDKEGREGPNIVASATLLEQDGVLSGGGAASRASFDVPVTAGAHLNIVLTSDAFDPVLEVTPPGAGALKNDDWQGSRTESRIDVVPAQAGVMKVSVSAVDQDANGAFHLRVSQVTPGGQGSGQGNGPVAPNRLLVVGATIEGQVDASDPALPDGRFQQSFLAAGADAGPADLRIEARGGETPLAIVMDPRGRALSPTSDGVYHISEPGPHRVQLIAPTAGQNAGFRMSLTQASNANATPQLSRNHHQLPTAAAREAVTLGQNVQGTIAAGDASLPTGEPADLYRLAGREGQVARIELRSDDFDTYLMVVGPTGRYWENDDTGGTTNSAIDLTLPSTGEYRVVASAYRAGMTGSYQLKLRESAASDTPVVAATTNANSASAVTRTGTLAAGDRTLDSGELVDQYNFEWPSGANYDVRVTSTDFDTYLIVREPGGEQHDNDDEGEGNTNSRLQVSTSTAGAYQVLVTSYQPGETGSYQLQITPSGAGATPAQPTQPPTTPAAEGRRVIRGELAQGDQTLRSGELVDVHPLQLRAGQTVHLEARSTAFDTYLILREPGGEQHDNDDGPGGGTNAALSFVAPVAGDYRVSVTSYRSGEVGAYELVIAEQASGTTAPPTAPDAPQPAVASGDRVSGALAQGDATLSSGEFADAFSRTFTAGQSVQIRLTSTQFDPYLIVRTPSGRQLDNDDLDSSTRDAGIDIPSAEAGQYRLTATSYRPGETGNYEMTFGAGQAIPSATGEGGGRVFGLFAGITDYPAGVGDLPECANDAIKLAEALRQSGLLDESRQVVLTDAQANRANVRSALQRLGSQMGPDDIFVFFYSGHGGQTQSTTDAREIDGTDEYLVLHDGPLLDNDLGTLFDSIRARVSVVALDACFSGGFAKDVITRPGRIGFFSSEEDVLSAVASQFQAGGYLSHFIRLAVTGEADMSPRDRVLTVGELSHFLYTQFGRHATDVQLQGAYQHLVVDRGAVGSDQVLWSYR